MILSGANLLLVSGYCNFFPYLPVALPASVGKKRTRSFFPFKAFCWVPGKVGGTSILDDFGGCFMQ